MVGLDISEEARQGAQANLNANADLTGLIEVRIRENQVVNSTGILLPALSEEERFSFSMCNPPFFSKLEEAGQNPLTAFQGTATEMVCPGGELAFVQQMVQDSLQLQERIYWYTSMVGKKTTLKAVRQQLQRLKVTALRVTEFVQGKTSRWGIAWSFSPAATASETAPLPRQDLKTQPLVAKKQTIFRVQGKGIHPERILKTLSSIFTAQGGQCSINLASFSLNAQLKIVDGDVASPDEQPKAKKQKTDAPKIEGIDVGVKVMMERPHQYAVQAKIAQASSLKEAEAFTRRMQEAKGDLLQILGIA